MVAADGTIEVMNPAAPGRELEELAKLAAAVDAGGDLLAVFDAEGRVRALNRAARDFFGIPEDGPLPALGTEQFLESDDPAVVEVGKALHNGVGRWEGELQIQGAHGQRGRFAIVVLAQHDEAGA